MGENSTERFAGLGCVGFVALPLILVGVILTRRAAARTGPEGEAAASATFLQRASKVLELLGGDTVSNPNPDGDRFDRFRAFDLNALTAAGWLLAMGAVCCLIGGSILLLWLIQRNREAEIGPAGAAVVLGGLLLAVAFFAGGRLLLGVFGIPTTRRSVQGQPWAPPAKRGGSAVTAQSDQTQSIPPDKPER
jgi:hypothetical protein